MDIDLYLEMRHLFRSKWDPVVLDVLSPGPRRFQEIVHHLQETLDDRFIDSHVKRSLARLLDVGLVRAEAFRLGQRQLFSYQITDAGQQVLELYHLMILAYTRSRPGPGGPR